MQTADVLREEMNIIEKSVISLQADHGLFVAPFPLAHGLPLITGAALTNDATNEKFSGLARTPHTLRRTILTETDI
jgi:hypothetical protein